MPGGRKGHYFSYEVKRVPDQTGNFRYYFVLHNRGSGLSDKELHGSFEAERGEGHRYMKTSVAIEVPQEALTAEFFEKLAESKESKTNSGPYGVIKEFLLAKGNGKIQFSDDEIACHKLSEELRSKATTLNSLTTLKALISSPHADQAHTLPDLPPAIQTLLGQLKSDPDNQGLKRQILQQAEGQIKSLGEEVGKLSQDLRRLEDKIIKEDSSIHTVQNHGDCIESNRSEPETQMAPNSLLKKLKLFTIQTLTTQVRNSSLPSEYKAVMEEASEKRQTKLTREVQDTWSSKMEVSSAAQRGGILPPAGKSDRVIPPSYQQATGGARPESPPLEGRQAVSGADAQPQESALTQHKAYVPNISTSEDAKRYLSQPQFPVGHCILRFSKEQNKFYLCMKVDGGNIQQHPIDSKMDNRSVSDLIMNFQIDYSRTRQWQSPPSNPQVMGGGEPQRPPSYQQATGGARPGSPPSYQQATGGARPGSPPSYQQATGGVRPGSPPLEGRQAVSGADAQPQESALTQHKAYVPNISTSEDAKSYLSQPQFPVGHCILRFSKAQNRFYLCMKVDGGNIQQHPIDSKMDPRAVSDLIANLIIDYSRTKRYE